MYHINKYRGGPGAARRDYSCIMDGMKSEADETGRAKALRSFYALAASNLFILGLALLRDWDVTEILVLYWAESGIVAGFAVLKILFAGRGGASGLPGGAVKFHLSKLLAAPLTAFMYGMVMAVVWQFMSVILSVSTGAEIGTMPGLGPLRAGLLALAAGHAFGFLKDYLLGGDFRSSSLKDLVIEPAAGMATLYFALLLGAVVMATEIISSPAALVTAFVAVRISLGLWPLMRRPVTRFLSLFF